MYLFKLALKVSLIFILSGLGLISIISVGLHFYTVASNDRNWNTDQTVLSYAEIRGSEISIHNIRDFTYTSDTEYIPHYYDKTFNLNDIKKHGML